MQDRPTMLSDSEMRASIRRELLRIEAIIDRKEQPGQRTLQSYEGLIKASRILMRLSRMCLTEIDQLTGEGP